jgi:hypothetical protein
LDKRNPKVHRRGCVALTNFAVFTNALEVTDPAAAAPLRFYRLTAPE